MLKKLVLISLLFAVPALAQSHSVSLSATASTTPGVAGYNVYRASGTVASCVSPACVKINASLLPSPVYTDSTVSPGAQYTYFMTAVCPATGCGNGITGESGFSNSVGAPIPTDLPQPPTNLTITSIARSISNGVTTVTVSWHDKPGVRTTYSLATHERYLKQGFAENAQGVYFTSWKGRLPADKRIEFTVCDTTCVSKSI